MMTIMTSHRHSHVHREIRKSRSQKQDIIPETTHTDDDDDDDLLSSSLPCVSLCQPIFNEPEVSTDSTDQWSNAIESYGDSLSEIVEDLIV